MRIEDPFQWDAGQGGKSFCLRLPEGLMYLHEADHVVHRDSCYEYFSWPGSPVQKSRKAGLAG